MSDAYLESLPTEDLSDVDDIDHEDADDRLEESKSTILFIVSCLNFLFHVWKCH